MFPLFSRSTVAGVRGHTATILSAVTGTIKGLNSGSRNATMWQPCCTSTKRLIANDFMDSLFRGVINAKKNSRSLWVIYSQVGFRLQQDSISWPVDESHFQKDFGRRMFVQVRGSLLNRRKFTAISPQIAPVSQLPVCRFSRLQPCTWQLQRLIVTDKSSPWHYLTACTQ